MYMYNIHYTAEKLHNFCHGCATAHSMNLQYTKLIDFYKSGYTMHSIHFSVLLFSLNSNTLKVINSNTVQWVTNNAGAL